MKLLAQARMLAERTPPARNRAADFFRAASIMAVVSGHWFVFAPYLDHGTFRYVRLLEAIPWTQFTTWGFQVMPVFFIVGGYANAASWASARRDPKRRRAWQSTRLRRLLVPTVPLVAAWCAAGLIARISGLPHSLIGGASQAALVPIWFLAVYIMVTVMVPVSAAVWRRIGLWSVIALALAAVCVDLIAFTCDAGWLRWSNYGFVWFAMHQLGYWWHATYRTDRPDRRGAVVLLVTGVAAMALIVGPLGYPVSMVTVRGEPVSNSSPPTIAMLAMGCTQGGLMLLCAGPVSRWMQNLRAWTAVILVSRMIMTVYLWHITAMVTVVALALLAGGVGLGTLPGEPAWWLSRPAWFAVLILALLPFILLFGALEAGTRHPPAGSPGPVRAVLGAAVACAGLTWLALRGASADNWLGVNLLPALLVFAGVGLSTIRAGNPRDHSATETNQR